MCVFFLERNLKHIRQNSKVLLQVNGRFVVIKCFSIGLKLSMINKRNIPGYLKLLHLDCHTVIHSEK